MNNNLERKISSAFKWSSVTEILTKLISPILNALLARILLPEDFAPLATITMLITFGEIFVESGFKKYLIQHEFDTEDDYKKAVNVSFWSNLMISLFIWGIIVVFSKHLATFLGNSEIWFAIVVSGVILPLYGIAGLLSGKLQKELNFKKLMVVRVTTSLVPLFVTIPLALLGLNYWSLVVGNIASVAAQTIVLVFTSKFKPQLFFSWSIFKQMYSYGFWTMVDGIAVWLTAWVDSFIIAKYMEEYYLGIYKNSISTVNALFSIVTAAVTPVLFVGLSKYQSDDKQFSSFFCSVQRSLSMLIIPLGVGAFLYSDVVVAILFGNNWKEAESIVGITAITLALRTVYVRICNEAYRAKAKFRIPFLIQVVDLCFLVPICIFSAQQGFWELVYARAFANVIIIIPQMIIMYKTLKINSFSQMNKIIPIYVAIGAMVICSLLLRMVSSSLLWTILSGFLVAIIYGSILFVIPSSRKELVALIHSKNSQG